MDKRVKFDFEIYFTNGGSLKGKDFRLDIDENEISDASLADYIVADMRLLMVGKVNIMNKAIFSELHKRKPISIAKEPDFLIDLSHKVESGLAAYTGTYIARPLYRFKNGQNLSEIALERLTGLDAIKISIPFYESLEITEKHLKNYEIRNKAVLIHTAWNSHPNMEDYYKKHPYLTEDAANYLKDCNVKLIGIDSPAIGNTTGKTRLVNTILSDENILIVEHLCNLHLLPNENFVFNAIPLKIMESDKLPVRAFAKMK